MAEEASWLDRREVPDVVLGKPPLAEVICQLRFPPVLRLQHDMALVAQIQDRLRDDYPILGNQAMLSLEIPGQLADSPKVSVDRAWRFTDTAGAWVVALASDFVALSTQAYTEWADFANRLETVVRAVGESIRLESATRFGLRYTDRIPIGDDPTSWSRVIERDLLGWLARPGDRPVEASLQEVRLGGEAGLVGFRHGVMQRGDSDESRMYLLDIDCYSEPAPTVDPAGLVTLATDFNGTANRFFFSAVTDEALASFEPRPKGGT